MKIEMSTTYFTVTNYAELAVQRQQFSVPYFSHGEWYVPHFRCVQWRKFIVRAAQHNATSSFALAGADGIPRSSEIVLHFEKRAISRTSKKSDALHRIASRCVARARANTPCEAHVFFVQRNFQWVSGKYIHVRVTKSVRIFRTKYIVVI